MFNVHVYGTLRKGFGNHGYLRNSRFVGVDRIRGFRMIDLGNFPMAIPTENPNCSLVIETYEINDKTLEILNELEGFVEGRENNLYERAEALSDSGIRGFIYYGTEKDRENCPGIVEGDWKLYREGREK